MSSIGPPGASSSAGPDRPVAVGLVVGAVVAVLRAWTSRGRVMYGIAPDEPGQLAISRYVSGLPRWNMFDHSTWRPLYGTVIAPLHWFIDDPSLYYEAAHVVNAVLGGIGAVLLYVLARRLTGLAAVWCGAIALTVALAPATLFTTDWVWSEALVGVVYPATILALLWFYDRPTIARGVALAVGCIAGYLTHTRLLPLALVSAGVVVVCMLRRRMSGRAGVAVLATFLVLYLVASWYSEWLVDRIWEAPSARNSYGGVVDQLKHVNSVAVSLVGQTWYLLVTTAGVFGIGAIAVVRAAVDGRSSREGVAFEHAHDRSPAVVPGPTVVDARLVIVAVGALMALSVVFMTERWRPDQIVYGRYNDAVAGPVLVIGLGWLVAQRHVVNVMLTYGWVIVTTVVIGGLLSTLRADELSEGVGVRAMILGLQGLMGSARSIDVLALTVGGASIAAAVALSTALSRRVGRPALVFVVLGVLMVFGYGRTRERMDAGINAWQLSAAMAPVRDDLLEDQSVVRMRFVPDGEDPTASLAQQRQRRMVYQFYLPHQALYTDGTEPDGAAAPYVFAPLDDPTMVSDGAELVWRDPGVSIGLWFDPNA